MQVFLTFISIAGSIWLWLVFFKKLKAKNVHWFWSFTLGGVASNFLAALLIGAVLMAVAAPNKKMDGALPSEIFTSVSDTRLRDAVSLNKNYVITQDEVLRPIKRSVEVLLDRRVSEKELTIIAKEILMARKVKVERTFIGYRVDGKSEGAYWATSHADPNVEVVIHGLTVAEYRVLRSFDVATAYPTAVGAWLRDDGLGFLAVAYKRRGKLFVDSIFADGSKSTERYVSENMADGSVRLFEPDNEYGEFYIMTGLGNLQGWNENGMYFDVIPVNAMEASST